MYKLSALEAEDIGFALTKGPTHYCAHCGQRPSKNTARVWYELKVGVETGYICHSCMLNLKHSLQKKIIKECN